MFVEPDLWQAKLRFAEQGKDRIPEHKEGFVAKFNFSWLKFSNFSFFPHKISIETKFYKNWKPKFLKKPHEINWNGTFSQLVFRFISSFFYHFLRYKENFAPFKFQVFLKKYPGPPFYNSFS